jgi:hypothetical protein
MKDNSNLEIMIDGMRENINKRDKDISFLQKTNISHALELNQLRYKNKKMHEMINGAYQELKERRKVNTSKEYILKNIYLLSGDEDKILLEEIIECAKVRWCINFGRNLNSKPKDRLNIIKDLFFSISQLDESKKSPLVKRLFNDLCQWNILQSLINPSEKEIDNIWSLMEKLEDDNAYLYYLPKFLLSLREYFDNYKFQKEESSFFKS